MVCTLLAGVNVVAFAADDELTDSTPVFCAYNKNNGEHFFTADEAEYNNLVSIGWDGEGQKWSAPLYSDSPIYRLYNQNSGEHYFTLSAAEAAMLASVGWNDEGVGMYSDDDMGTPIYCMYNPNATGQFEAGAHHYTKDEAEASSLESLGWVWTNDGQAAFYGVVEEEPTILVSITDVDQLTANSIYVEFDQDASLLVDKDDFVVYKADGTLVLPVDSMTMAADGMSAELNLSINLQDSVDYVVELNDSEAGFTASIGEVALVAITTASAQKGVETPIEYALYDEQGVDITSTVDLDDCDIIFDGEYADYEDDPEGPTITMDEVGAEATVVISYMTDDMENAVVGEATITCIPAEAVVGTPVYYETDDQMYINQNNGMAKFYWGLIGSEPITVVVDGDASETVSFCAVDLSDFSVYEYDEWEITSSDENVISIASDNSEGKNAQFTVVGNQVGTANVVIEATVNEVSSFYTVPVRVVNEGTLKTVSYTVDKSKLTNAIDSNYHAKSVIKAEDSNGKDITDDIQVSYEVTTGDYEDNDIDDIAGDLVDTTMDTNIYLHKDPGTAVKMSKGFKVIEDDDEAYYTAYAANQSGKRKVTATISYEDKEIAKTISITVDKLSDDSWNATGNTAAKQKSVDYELELSGATVNSSMDDLLKTEARLAAYVGKKFVGYVRTTNGYETIGTPNTANVQAGTAATASTNSAIGITTASRIDADTLNFAVKWGSKYNSTLNTTAADLGLTMNSLINPLGNVQSDAYDMTLKQVRDAAAARVAAGGANNLYGSVTIFACPMSWANTIQTAAAGTGVAEINTNYVSGSAKLTTDFAQPGTYTPTFVWNYMDGTEDKAEGKLTAANMVDTLAAGERVNVKYTSLSDYSIDGIEDAIYTLTDMNNNEDDTTAVQGFAEADLTPITTVDSSGKQYIRYVIVNDNAYGTTTLNGFDVNVAISINFYIPISTTFRQK